MTVNLSMLAGAGAQFFDNNGHPLSGGKLYSYEAGTTTPKTTYTTSAGVTAHTNPIVLDSAGRVPSGGEIWLIDGGNYKFALYTSKDVLIATYDNVTGNGSGILASLAAPSGSRLVGFSHAETYPQGTVGLALQVAINIKNAPYNAVGGTTDDSAAIQAAVDALPSGGGRIVFPTGTYTFKDINVIDKESVSFEFSDSVVNLAPGAQYAVKFQNTSAIFKKGGIFSDVTFGTGSAAVGIIWIDGGAWTNQVITRIANNAVVAPSLIYYSNNTSPLRNPSNFTITQVFDRSYGCDYLFHYDAAATTTNFDNFVINHILHYCDTNGGAVIHFDGAAALYSSFENIYGGMYADNTRLVKMTGSIAASRNNWQNLLMEGSGNNRICMDGYYNESIIKTVINYVDENLYTGNQAFSARLTSSHLDNLLVQNASTGAYSTNTAVTLLAGSSTNDIFKIGVLSDLGSKNTVYRGQGDYLVSQLYQQTYTSNTAPAILSLKFADFEVNDVIKIFIAGTASGLYKDLELLEASVRSLFTMPGGLLTEDWSVEITYQVISVAGVKSLSPHLRVFKGTTCVINEFKTPVSFFPATFQLILSVTAPNWTGSSIVMRTAYAAPLFNQN